MGFYFQCFNCAKVHPVSDENFLTCENCGSSQGLRRTQDEYDNFQRLGWFTIPLARRKRPTQ
jgi:rRNA maturation endonuclease Nob1